MKDGILNINKPKEMTSFDVVHLLRKKLGIKRIGHLGTLDPMAEGVLPVALGKAARVMDYLGLDMKEYIAEFIFGMSTDTDDIWGRELALSEGGSVESEKNLESADIGITREKVEASLKSFLGVTEQVPPNYSALKVDGKKMYEYARKGQEIEKKAREVYIPSIGVLDFGERSVEEFDGRVFKYVVLRILCGKGTYIRSIARDLGKILGVGSCMSSLLRTKSGAFDISESIKLDDIIELSEERIEELMVSPDMALSAFPKTVIGGWEEKLFKNGVCLRSDQWKGDTSENNNLKEFPLKLPEDYYNSYRVYGDEGFVGIGVLQEDGGLKAKKVLV